MTSTRELAEKIAEERDVPVPEMLEIVRVYAGLIADDTDLYDVEADEFSDAGAELIVTSVTESALYTTASVLDDLAEAQEDVDRQEDRLRRRDAAIRAALKEGVSVREIVKRTGLSRERVYQIRDGRR